MATIFLGYRRTAYLHPGKTITAHYYAEPTFKLLDVMKQKDWRKLSLKKFWLFHENAPAHKSLVALKGLYNCEFVQLLLNQSAYSPILAPSDHFLIRNLKYHLRGTWFIVDESLKIAIKAWSESQNKKFYFQGINSWQQKLKICIAVAWAYVKKWQRV